nr:putative holin-like toxin [Shouchella lehensis]
MVALSRGGGAVSVFEALSLALGFGMFILALVTLVLLLIKKN